MSRSTWLLSAALAVSLVLHAGVAAFVFDTPKPSLGEATLAGEGGVEVGLGQAGSYSAVVPKKEKPSQTSEDKPKKNRESTNKPELKKEIEKPAEKVDPPLDSKPPISKPEIVEKAALEKAPVIVEETLVQDERATDVVLPEQVLAAPSEAETAQSKPDSEIKNNDEALAEPEQKAAVKATGRSDHKKSGARKGDSRHYYGEIMAWLTQYKDYPASLKKKKKEGVVTVQFTIDRMGNVLRKKIIKSSGIEGLDNSALAMLDAASPVPSMPRWMKKKELTIALPIEYSLVTNKSFRRKHER